MKKKIFNGKIYKQTLKKLLLPSIILAAISIILTIIPIASAIAAAPFTAESNSQITVFTLTQCLYFAIYPISFILTFITFSYMNKRDGSDFYFSLPEKRVTLLTSQSLAVATLSFLIIAANLLVSIIGGVVLGAIIPFSSFALHLLAYTLIALCIIFCTILAMSLTGTVFANIVVTGIILFLPRVTVLFAQMIITHAARVVPVFALGEFFNPAINLVFSPVGMLINHISPAEIFLNGATNYIYTAVLLAAFIVLAYVSFIKRRSETAEKTAPTRLISTVYKCTLTIPFLMIFFVLFTNYSSENMARANMAPLMVVLTAALTVFIVYEAINSKSIKNIIKSIPLFIVLCLATGLMAIASQNIGKGLMHYVPAAEDIQSVNIIPTTADDPTNSFTISNIADVEFTEEDIVKTAVNDLSNCITRYENSEFSYLNDYRITYNLKNGETCHRSISLTEPEELSLRSKMHSTPEYRKAIATIPKKSQITNFRIAALEDSDSCYKILEAYAQDTASDNFNFSATSANSPSELTLYVYINEGNGKYSRAYYPISTDTPLALKTYFELSDNKENFQKATTNVNLAIKNKENISCYASNADIGYKDVHSWGINLSANIGANYDPYYIEKFIEIIDEALNNPIDGDGIFTTVNISNIDQGYSVYCILTDEQMTELNKLQLNFDNQNNN